MNAVFTSLELDKEDVSSKMICFITEELCDSNFIVSSFISDAVRSNSGLCLVIPHRCFDHYDLIGVKSRYSLNSCLQNGSLIHIDVTKDIVDRIDGFQFMNLFDDCYIAKLALKIKSAVETLSKNYDKVVLIIDRISDFINGGCPVNTVIKLAHHLLVLISLYPKTVLAIGSQISREDKDKKRLMDYLMNSADYRIVISPLKTGYSTEVSGSIKYSKKDPNSITMWSKEQTHHFKVTDRNIQVFAPGSVS